MYLKQILNFEYKKASLYRKYILNFELKFNIYDNTKYALFFIKQKCMYTKII